MKFKIIAKYINEEEIEAESEEKAVEIFEKNEESFPGIDFALACREDFDIEEVFQDD